MTAFRAPQPAGRRGARSGTRDGDRVRHAVDRIVTTQGTVRIDASTFFWQQCAVNLGLDPSQWPLAQPGVLVCCSSVRTLAKVGRLLELASSVAGGVPMFLG